MHLCVCACVYVIVCVHYALFYHSLWACACRDFQMLNKVINFSIVLMAVPLGVRTQRAVLCNTSFLRTGALAHQPAFLQWCHSAATDVSCKNPSARGELWCMVRIHVWDQYPLNPWNFPLDKSISCWTDKTLGPMDKSSSPERQSHGQSLGLTVPPFIFKVGEM